MIPVCYHNAKSISKWGVKHLIRNIRKLKKLTQEQLARDLGVRRSTVAMWETGKAMPRAALLPKLADILGCTVDELLRGGEAR